MSKYLPKRLKVNVNSFLPISQRHNWGTETVVTVGIFCAAGLKTFVEHPCFRICSFLAATSIFETLSTVMAATLCSISLTDQVSKDQHARNLTLFLFLLMNSHTNRHTEQQRWTKSNHWFLFIHRSQIKGLHNLYSKWRPLSLNPVQFFFYWFRLHGTCMSSHSSLPLDDSQNRGPPVPLVVHHKLIGFADIAPCDKVLCSPL